MAQVRVAGTCRGEGYGYVALALGGQAAGERLEAVAHGAGGVALPCQVALLDGAAACGEAPLAVLVVPLLSCDLSLELRTGGRPLWSGTFVPLTSKVASRLLTRRRPELAAALRGIGGGTDAARVDVTDIWPAGPHERVWRIRASFPTGNAQAKASLLLQDGHGRAIGAPCIVMEDHVVPAPCSPTEQERLVTFSARVPAEVRHLCATALLEGDPAARGFRCLLPYQTDGLIETARRRMCGAGADPTYHAWFLEHRTGHAAIARQREAAAELPGNAPRFCVVAAGGCSQATRRSLEAQTYPRWELADRPGDATCSHLVLLGAHDVLEPDCLWRFCEELLAHPGTDVLTCDSDVLDGSRFVRPRLLPAANYDKLLSHDYLGRPLVVGTMAYTALRLDADTAPELLGYEVALRAFERGLAFAHVPRVLCHTSLQDVPPSDEALRAAVAAHLERRGIAATVEPGPHPHTNHVRYQLPEPAPHVSVVIPSKDHKDLLEACVASVLDRTDYPSFDVTIVENNSCEPETFALYERLSRDPRVRVVTWRPGLHAENGFNYAAIVNHGARCCTGELIVFLNNDTEVIARDWLREMAGLLTRPDVGVVGAKLLFGDGLVQHAGLSANPNCDFLHPNQNLAADEPGYLCSAGVVSDTPMVTGACQMVRRSLFEQLGGYDEELAVGFNDGDFCLRVRASGHRVVFTPFALLHHREFSSRGREAADVQLQARYLREKAYTMARHADFLAAGDPTVSPHLDRFSPWRELRRP